MSVHSRKTNKTDGFQNIYKKIGSNRDVTTSTGYVRNAYLSQNYQTCNGLYTNSLAGKAVDIPIEDAFKGGREYVCEDTKKLDEYIQFQEDINLEEQLKQLYTWAKIFGSAVAIVMSDDDEMSEPLIVDNIKKGDVKGIRILDRWQLYSTDLNRNPLSENFLDPQYYYVTRTSLRIHHSRVFKVDGLNTTIYDKEVLNGWGLTVYERLYKEIMNAQMSPDLLINLLVQSNLDVFQIEELNETILNSGDEFIQKRLQAVMDGKSIMNSIVLDKKDGYTNIAKSFSGLDAVHDKFIELLCSSSEIPETRFMGKQSTGISNDGIGDLKHYYDRIESRERKQIKKMYNFFDPILTKSYFGETLDFDYEFTSLFQMTDAQKADIRNKNANTNQIYLGNGVVTAAEVKETLITDPYYSTITTETIEEENKIDKSLDELGFNE